VFPLAHRLPRAVLCPSLFSDSAIRAIGALKLRAYPRLFVPSHGLRTHRPSPGTRENWSVTIPGFCGTCVTGHPVAPFAREAGQSLWRAVSSAEATVALSLSRFVGTL